MRLEGIHHVTCITGDAPGNVGFYTGVLGLRLVKKTVNQDDPTVYHLFYADEDGSPGADITFFEYPGARRGRAGDGMVHTVSFRVASEDALGFWEARLAGRAPAATRDAGHGCGSRTRRASGSSWSSRTTSDEPLVARHPEIPRRARAPGVRRRPRVRARPRAEPAPARGGARASASTGPAGWEVRGETRGGLFGYDAPPARGAACPGRAPSITSPGRRRWRTTTPGSGASRRRECTRRR